MIDLQDVNHSYSPPEAENTHLVVFTYMIFFDIYKTTATESGSEKILRREKSYGEISIALGD
jgi:hypothetical protein